MKFFIALFLLIFSFSMYGIAGDIFNTSICPADVDTGLYLISLNNKKVALIINQTSYIGKRSLLDVLIANKINVVKIFVPEHGFRGKEDAGAKVGDAIDSLTGVPLVSLYGSHKKPKPEDLTDVDVIVYDLQDVGVRFYTYISTLQYCMEAAAENKKQFIILDRPDPLGFYVDGPVLDTAYRSFIGMQPIPIVYGMTPGEYATMLIGEKWFAQAAGLDLVVIKCKNYNHSKKYKLLIAPSPNLRTMAAIYAYPSLCLFEGTKVSVGRGTSKPFLQFGCPEFEGKYEYNFTPKSGEGAKSPLYQDKVCYGDTIILEPASLLEKLDDRLCLSWLIQAYHSYPEKGKFFDPFFTKVAGSQTLTKQIENGISESEIRASWQNDIKKFKKLRKKYLLYKDFE